MKPEEALDQISYLRGLVDQSRLRIAGGYLYFLVYGLLWTIGYTGSIWLDQGMLWDVLYVVGIVATVMIARRSKPAGPLPLLLRQLAALSYIYLGASVVLMVALVPSAHVVNAFWPFQIGVGYLISGLFLGQELYFIGGWLIGAAVLAYWLPSPGQNIWLAVAGGGGQMLTGLLLRRQVMRG